jgi:hypothetical protein
MKFTPPKPRPVEASAGPTEAVAAVDFDIADVAKMLRPPLAALSDARGYIGDASTLVARCRRGHIHKYFVVDIVKSSGAVECPTCAVKVKYLSKLHSVAEKLFETPFVIEGRAVVCPALELVICFDSKADAARYPQRYLFLSLGPVIYSRAAMERQILLRLEDSAATLERPRLAFRIAHLFDRPKLDIVDPLPFTAALAMERAAMAVGSQCSLSSFLVVESKYLCLENC